MSTTANAKRAIKEMKISPYSGGKLAGMVFLKDNIKKPRTWYLLKQFKSNFDNVRFFSFSTYL